MQEADARKLVEQELARMSADGAPALGITSVAEFEHGWLVFYDGLESGPLAGNAPFIVDARTGRLVVTGTARSTDFYVDNYVRTGDPLGRGGLEKVAEDLNLPSPGTSPSQDWGIEHADPRRFGEFAQYFTQRVGDLDQAACDDAADLVLQSANEALEEGLRVNAGLFARFLDIAQHAAPERVSYWRSLSATDADPWPVTKLLGACGEC